MKLQNLSCLINLELTFFYSNHFKKVYSYRTIYRTITIYNLQKVSDVGSIWGLESKRTQKGPQFETGNYGKEDQEWD